MTESEILQKLAVKTFKKHWSDILKKSDQNQSSYAQRYYRCFEADTEAGQKKLAERFYGPSHAAKMVHLTDRAILQRISCYLPRAIEYALSQYEPKEQRDFIKKLVSHEYVIFNSSQCQRKEDYDENWEGLWIAPYPERVAYDDWYERTLASSYFTCGTFLLMKSTGEPFSKKEVDWLRKSIMNNIDQNDPYSLWWFECEPLEKNRIWIKIYEFIDMNSYIDGLSGFISTMSEDQLTLLLNRTVSFLSENRRNLPLLKILKKQSGKDKTTFNAINSLLQAVSDDFVIREIERLACDITGRKDRDYHYGQNY